MISLTLLIYPLNNCPLTNPLLAFEFQQRLSLSLSLPRSGDSAGDLPTAFRASGVQTPGGVSTTPVIPLTLGPSLYSALQPGSNPITPFVLPGTDKP